MKKEEKLQIAVSKYLKLQYPDVIFTAESSGLKLTIGQAVIAKKLRSDRGLPDLMIFEPNKYQKGLFIELKAAGVRLKSGDLPNTEHIREQTALLLRLCDRGYAASFACGFDEAKEIIDEYLKLRK
jgi:hypothetical protein